MTAKELRVVRDAKPFVPFSIRVPNGTTVSIFHPDNISVSPNGGLVALYYADAWSVFDIASLNELHTDAHFSINR